MGASKVRAASEPLDDLPGTHVFLVRVGPHQIEVELISVNFGKVLSPASEIFEIEELILLEAVHGFHIASVGVG